MADPILFMREEDMPYQPVSIASMEWNKTGNWRYLRPRFENKIPPCNEGCPAGQDIEGAMVLIGKGKIPGSLGAFQTGEPFSRRSAGGSATIPANPPATGGISMKPLSINALERFMADMASKQGRRIILEKGKAAGESRGHRLRPGGTDLRLSPGPDGLRGHGLRSPAGSGGNAPGGDPGIPAPQESFGGGDRPDPGAGGQGGDQHPAGREPFPGRSEAIPGRLRGRGKPPEQEPGDPGGRGRRGS